jgi:hypothetical protein
MMLMVGTSWKGALVVLVAWAGVALGQQAAGPPHATGPETYLMIEENGKPAQKCRIVCCWTENGQRYCQVQSVATGEIMTIIDPPLPPEAPELVLSNPQTPVATSRKILHWGRSKSVPAGFPVPPTGASEIVCGPGGGSMEVVQSCPTCDQEGGIGSQPRTKILAFGRPSLQDGSFPAQTSPPQMLSPGGSQMIIQGNGPTNLAAIATQTPAPPMAQCQNTVQPTPAFGDRIRWLFGYRNPAPTETYKATAETTVVPGYRYVTQSTVAQQPATTQYQVVAKPDIKVPAAPPVKLAYLPVPKMPDLPPGPTPEAPIVKKSELPPPLTQPKTNLAKGSDSPALPSSGPDGDKKTDPLLDTKSFAPKAVQDRFPSVGLDTRPIKPGATGYTSGLMPNYTPGSSVVYGGAPAYKGLPPGSRSVIEANNGLATGARFIPVPVVTVPAPNNPPGPPPPQIPNAPQPNWAINAFTPPANPDDESAKLQGQVSQYNMGSGYPMGGMSPQMAYGMRPPMMYPGQAYPYAGNPNMMANASPYGMNSPRNYAGPQAPQPNQQVNLAQVGYQSPGNYGYPMQASYPYPAYYGYPAQVAYANPAMDRPGMPVNTQVAQTSGQDAIYQMLVTLKSSLYPAQREWCAMNLAHFDWRQNPHVVQGLLVAAKEDPAPTVRSACVTSLAAMQVAKSVIAPTLEGLKTDSDPRVRLAATQALGQTGVLPASGSAPSAGPAAPTMSGAGAPGRASVTDQVPPPVPPAGATGMMPLPPGASR